jgi:hypothetical protein
MKSSKTPVIGSPERPVNSVPLAQHASAIVTYHGERILAEIPTAIRRFGIFLLVLSISIPIFLAALLVVLWRLGS